MRKVESKQELSTVKKLGKTIYLRKNITQKTVDTNEEDNETIYIADEVYFEKDNINLEHINNNFDLYWSWAKEKREKEKVQQEKKKVVEQLINTNYDLADLKETVDQLVVNNLS